MRGISIAGLSRLSMASPKWTTGATESFTTDLKTGGSKSGRVAALVEQDEKAVLTVPYASPWSSGPWDAAFSLLRLSR